MRLPPRTTYLPRLVLSAAVLGLSALPVVKAAARTEKKDPTILVILDSYPETIFTLTTLTSGGELLKSADAGVHWARIKTIPVGKITFLTTDFGHREVLLIEIEGRIYASTDAGVSWSAVEVNDADMQKPIPKVNVADPMVLYARVGGRLLYSLDGAKSWTAFSPAIKRQDGATLTVFGVWIDPKDSQSIFAEVPLAFYHSDDGGNTWRQLSLPGVQLAFLGNVLLFDGNGAIYLRTGPLYIDSSAGDVYRSDHGLQTWKRIELAEQGNVPVDFFGLAAESLYVTGTNYLYPDVSMLFRSTDGGVHWNATRTPFSSQISDLVRAPNDPSALYAAADHRVLKSTDGGSKWRSTGFK